MKIEDFGKYRETQETTRIRGNADKFPTLFDDEIIKTLTIDFDQAIDILHKIPINKAQLENIVKNLQDHVQGLKDDKKWLRTTAAIDTLNLILQYPEGFKAFYLEIGNAIGSIQMTLYLFKNKGATAEKLIQVQLSSSLEYNAYLLKNCLDIMPRKMGPILKDKCEELITDLQKAHLPDTQRYELDKVIKAFALFEVNPELFYTATFHLANLIRQS